MLHFQAEMAGGEKPRPALSAKLCFAKACMTQSVSLGWIRGYQNKDICVETSS